MGSRIDHKATDSGQAWSHGNDPYGQSNAGHSDAGHSDPWASGHGAGLSDPWGFMDDSHIGGMHVDEWHHKVDWEGRLLDDAQKLVVIKDTDKGEEHHILFDHTGYGVDDWGHPIKVDGFDFTVDKKGMVVTGLKEVL